MPRRLPKQRREEIDREEARRQWRMRRVLDLTVVLAHHGSCAQDDAIGQTWHEAEIAHEAAQNRNQARRATADIIDLCEQCPVQQLCFHWAHLDGYSGLAAGAKWIDGVPHTIDSVSKRLRPLADTDPRWAGLPNGYRRSA